MPERFHTLLPARAALCVAGEDRRTFLQGLVSSDATKVDATHARHAAFLSAQGRFLHEFFMLAVGEAIHLDAEAARLDDLARRLKLYKLRAKVTLAPSAGLVVAAFWGENAAAAFGLPDEAGAAKELAGGAVYADPRLPALGVRALLPEAGVAALAAEHGFAAATPEAYDRLRLSLGVPDGSRDLPVDGALLLENGFDELGGVDWKKGCYVGQEVTARMKYRALVRKRLMPVRIDGPAPPAGTRVMLGDAEAGEMRSAAGDLGLALLRIESVEKAAADGTALVAGEAKLVPHKPGWANF
ncbi:MAG: folate-binding protein YgfZ [Rhodospirillales bacterium]|nr:folate-binding protein YgfZ [Rhodospirillales bacterium]